jgi:hypothetical protein
VLQELYCITGCIGSAWTNFRSELFIQNKFFGFISVGTRRTHNSARTENEGTFTNAFLMPVKLFVATPGTFARLRQPMLRRVHVCIVTDGLSGALVVNCDLIKNTNSAVTGLGTCVVHQL